jgi:hypothetical protein
MMAPTAAGQAGFLKEAATSALALAHPTPPPDPPPPGRRTPPGWSPVVAPPDPHISAGANRSAPEGRRDVGAFYQRATGLSIWHTNAVLPNFGARRRRVQAPVRHVRAGNAAVPTNLAHSMIRSTLGSLPEHDPPVTAPGGHSRRRGPPTLSPRRFPPRNGPRPHVTNRPGKPSRPRVRSSRVGRRHRQPPAGNRVPTRTEPDDAQRPVG